ncbi:MULTISPECIES: amino acid permease [Thermoactinomyces]|uniref:Amino acid permease n=1 Tax=Thermoactinomyces daqus TaxID=1329516 RepID=A0A7W2AHB9_9BACL|nr:MULTISPECIES: amino acid permease [Thermoactinomyces]MBA4542521.1 amino acid permease [Thermoactinomyces daqus]MBH8607083.1 amino acid permease [Thermoactinomyces sp. CICC 10521]
MSDHLQKQLLPRHVQMMALGGAIGAGIFQGSAETISAAGPGVIFSYALAGILLYIVMSAMAEMALGFAGTDLRGLVHKAFGTRVSFILGWLYFIQWVLVMAVEIVTAGTFLQYWFSVPVWLLSLIVTLVIIAINLFSVRLFGEIEYWLTSVKIVTLIVFVILGALLLFGIIPSAQAPGLTNYRVHGGFFPLGWQGVLSSLLIVIFSYGGTEMIGLTITEMKDAKKTLPRVIKGVILRICLFYVLPLLIITGLIPWDQVKSSGSPFVEVLSAVGLKGVANIMNFILLTAVISAANSGMYATTRMLYSLAGEKEAPAFFTRLGKRGVPIYALAASSVCLFLGSLVAFIAPESVFQYLMGIPGYTVILTWILICLSHLKLRGKYERTPDFRLSFFPFTTGITLIVLAAIMIFVLLSPKNLINTIVYLAIILVLTIASQWLKPNQRILTE